MSLPLAAPTRAQRSNDNAVTAAADAFGTSVGTQAVGLYTPTNARGFNPTEAQNIRIEGLYFDQQTSGTDPYLFSGTDIRVGLAAQSYAFPSPSGIADLKLRVPGDHATASIVVSRGPWQQSAAEVDTQYPLMDRRVSVGVTAALTRNFDYYSALSSARNAVSLVLRFLPHSGVELTPFIGYIRNTESRETPIVFSDGVHSPPLFDEQKLPTLPWTRWRWNQLTAGVIAKSTIAGPWSIRAGLFRSSESSQSFMDIMSGLTSEGSASRMVDISPPHMSASDSADVRVTRSTADDSGQRELTFTARGRVVDHYFGGDSVDDLGPTSIYRAVTTPAPTITFGEQNADEVRQFGVGISYTRRWNRFGSLNLGVLATRYRRILKSPGSADAAERTGVVLPAAGFTANVNAFSNLYGGYTQGLEDSLIAPASAANRGELPAATRTWQIDGGIRFVLHPHLQWLLGGFEVHKPYFSVGNTNRYGQVGSIVVRGVESSATLTGSQGLTAIVGGAWLRPRVARDVAEPGAIGNVPVGPVPLTLNFNVDYAPPSWKGLGATLQLTSLSARVATANDLDKLRPLTVLNLGMRYKFKIQRSPCSVRLDVANLANSAGLMLSSTYTVFPQQRRNYTFTVAADF